MCGIVGITSPDEGRTVRGMLAALRHRGPDDEGMLVDAHHALGHARLSIIDLGGGKQPMSDPLGESHVVFNGEIYNHLDLRAELGHCSFRTNSDTEVLLHLAESNRSPEEWVTRLDGMFAFALSSGGKLTLARDPLGIKPLYVGKRDGATVFGSEIKAMLVACEDVTEFPPGHVYTDDNGLQEYFRLEPERAMVEVQEAAFREIRAKLEEAVRKRLLADVPVGVFLSGGLDSSLIAALARRHKDPLDTFAVGTGDSEDLVRAREVADHLGTRHHELIYDLEQVVAALPEVIYHLESFDRALVRSAMPNYLLAQLTSQHVKVALSGEGADELFAGYRYLKSVPLDSLHDELLEITEALHNTNLQRCDRMSMAHGLEVRVPFLDIDFVSYAFRVPVEMKLEGPERTEKFILRRVAEDLLPKDIAWRKKAKFAIGSGLGDGVARYAEGKISDEEFARAREIRDGICVDSKEELLYYRLFRQQFPAEGLVGLVGRSRSI
jgi:asparagine synthase (glutamine-hydrolysing)